MLERSTLGSETGSADVSILLRKHIDSLMGSPCKDFPGEAGESFLGGLLAVITTGTLH